MPARTRAGKRSSGCCRKTPSLPSYHRTQLPIVRPSAVSRVRALSKRKPKEPRLSTGYVVHAMPASQPNPPTQRQCKSTIIITTQSIPSRNRRQRASARYAVHAIPFIPTSNPKNPSDHRLSLRLLTPLLHPQQLQNPPYPAAQPSPAINLLNKQQRLPRQTP